MHNYTFKHFIDDVTELSFLSSSLTNLVIGNHPRFSILNNFFPGRRTLNLTESCYP